MVNASANFNRNYQKKRKLIRDKKRARIRGKKRRLGYDDKNEKPKTKREIKEEIREEKKNENVLKAAGMTAEEVHNLVNYRKDRIRRIRKRRRDKRYIRQDDKDMDIEKEEEIKK